MNRNFERALPLVLKHEGGFANHPKDPGGATMKGVTLATFRRYKPGATVADLKAISPNILAQIYRDGYWNEVNGDDLPAGVDYAVFDFAVNSGPGRAAEYLQAVAGVAQDGRVGPQTIAAVAKLDPASVINSLCNRRLAFLKRLKTWPTFGKGWESRVAGVRKEALAMVGSNATAPEPAAPVGTKPALPAENGTVTTLPPDNSKLPAKNVFLAWCIDLILAIFGRKPK